MQLVDSNGAIGVLMMLEDTMIGLITLAFLATLDHSHQTMEGSFLSGTPLCCLNMETEF